MANKKIVIWHEEDRAGALFYDGNRKTRWEQLTRDEQVGLLNAMAGMFELFSKFVKNEGQ